MAEEERQGRHARLRRTARARILYTGTWAADDARRSSATTSWSCRRPDFGNGPKIGGGSWQWGVSSAAAATPRARMDYLKFAAAGQVLRPLSRRPPDIIPATDEAAALIPGFAEGGANRIFLRVLQASSR